MSATICAAALSTSQCAVKYAVSHSCRNAQTLGSAAIAAAKHRIALDNAHTSAQHSQASASKQTSRLSKRVRRLWDATEKPIAGNKKLKLTPAAVSTTGVGSTAGRPIASLENPAASDPISSHRALQSPPLVVSHPQQSRSPAKLLRSSSIAA